MKNIVKKLKLTPEQEDDICYLIGEWYLIWKDRIVPGGGEHRLGSAKEYLKAIICGCCIICGEKKCECE